jgi:hypothetical protein
MRSDIRPVSGQLKPGQRMQRHALKAAGLSGADGPKRCTPA